MQLVSGPGSTMLMLALQPGRRTRGPLARGASPQELRDTFLGWELMADDAADTSCRSAPPRSSVGCSGRTHHLEITSEPVCALGLGWTTSRERRWSSRRATARLQAADLHHGQGWPRPSPGRQARSADVAGPTRRARRRAHASTALMAPHVVSPSRRAFRPTRQTASAGWCRRLKAGLAAVLPVVKTVQRLTNVWWFRISRPPPRQGCWVDRTCVNVPPSPIHSQRAVLPRDGFSPRSVRSAERGPDPRPRSPPVPDCHLMRQTVDLVDGPGITENLGQTGGVIEALYLPSHLDPRPVGFDEVWHRR